MCVDPKRHKAEDLPNSLDNAFSAWLKLEMRNADHMEEIWKVLMQAEAIIPSKEVA